MLPPAYGSRPATEPRLITWPAFLALKSSAIDCQRANINIILPVNTFNEQLRHGYKAKDVRSEHSFNVRIGDVSCVLNAKDISRIID